MEMCMACGKPVTRDEMAMTRKLINRGADRFLCIPCLARRFEASEQELLERMQDYKAMGCTLFDCNRT
ncbi:MAG: hypothetical protein ACI4MG_07175 [Aristaeellaceae bacterium]